MANGTQKRGMGRGLSAILSTASKESDNELLQLSPQSITPNPDQPRRRFDQDALLALSESVRASGVLQPVLVRPASEPGTYTLVAGERRWRAAQLAELESIPAISQDLDDGQTLEIALVENMVREDLNPVEEARACAALIEDLGLTREEVGKRVGRSRVAISNLVRLLDLPDDLLDLLEQGTLSEGHGRAILGVPDLETRRLLARSAVSEGWSVRKTEERVRQLATPRSNGGKKRQVHPDQLEAIEGASNAISRSLGVEAKVKPRKDGYRIEIDFETSERMFAFIASLDR